MQISFIDGDLGAVKARCLLVLADKKGQLLNGPQALREKLAPLAESGEFGDDLGASFYFPEVAGVAAERVLVVNVGEKVRRADDLRRATALGWKAARARKHTKLCFSLDGLGDESHVRAAFEGLALGSYTFTELKSEKEKLPKVLESLELHSADDQWPEKVKQWHAIAKGVMQTRDLCQLPANILTPSNLAERARGLAEEGGFTINVLDEAAMREMGMGSLLSVSQGSDQPPALIVMDYQPAQKAQKTIAFVGKAVTFDSGGLSLKPANSMPDMKGDMGGGGTVVGIMSTLKAIHCPHRVIGVVPAVENMPSGRATRPSDVVTSMSGVTIEINNTDAEGRLILADALTYVDRFEPDYVVDFATLTGACLVALGPKICAVMGNHEGLVEAIVSSGKDLHEPFWELPLYEEYKPFLKSSVADIANISSVRWGGTITAGLFLERFAGKYQWAHCDIAPAIYDKADDYHPSGGTGIGVRMAIEMMNRLGD